MFAGWRPSTLMVSLIAITLRIEKFPLTKMTWMNLKAIWTSLKTRFLHMLRTLDTIGRHGSRSQSEFFVTVLCELDSYDKLYPLFTPECLHMQYRIWNYTSQSSEVFKYYLILILFPFSCSGCNSRIYWIFQIFHSLFFINFNFVGDLYVSVHIITG